MKIGELSKLLNINIQTIRYYEREGLLGPVFRCNNGYRIYTDEHLSRFFFIIKCKKMGFSLKEIKDFLTGTIYESVCISHWSNEALKDLLKKIAQKKIRDINKEILELEEKKREIKNYISSS